MTSKDIIEDSLKQEEERPVAFGKTNGTPVKLELGKSGKGKYFVSNTILTSEGIIGRTSNFEKFASDKKAKMYFLKLVKKYDLRRVNELEIEKQLHRQYGSNFLDSTGYYSRLKTSSGAPPKIEDLKGLQEMIQNLDDEFILKKMKLPSGIYLMGISSTADSFAIDGVSHFHDEEHFKEFWSAVSKHTEAFMFYQSSQRFEILDLEKINGVNVLKVKCKDGNIKTEKLAMTINVGGGEELTTKDRRKPPEELEAEDVFNLFLETIGVDKNDYNEDDLELIIEAIKDERLVEG